VFADVAGASHEVQEAANEAGVLVSLLEERHAALAGSLGAGFPELRASLWHSEASVQASVQVSLVPHLVRRSALHLAICLMLKSCCVLDGMSNSSEMQV